MTGHPRDQADGFFEDSDDAAGREAFGGYDGIWEFIYALNELAILKEWTEMAHDLDHFSGVIPYHEFSESAFRRAAAAGRTDILVKMLANGFELPADAGARMVDHLAAHHLPQAEQAVGKLLDLGFRGEHAVLNVAELGTPAMLEVLRKHGCDVLERGASFALAMHAGNTATMDYLYAQGADLYSPAAVKGIYGGIEKYQSTYTAHVLGPAAGAREKYQALVAKDGARWEATYALEAGEMPSLDTLRGISDTAGLPLLHLAARAGKVSDLVEASLRDKNLPLTADELLAKSETGASVLSVLAARGEAKQIFDARLWWRAPAEGEKLLAGLDALGAKDVIDMESFTADMQRCRLRAAGGGARLRLRPGR